MKMTSCCIAWCRADYAIALLLLGFAVTLAGQGSTYWLMSRLQRRSIVIIAMASLMLLATAVMYYESIITFLYALHHHTLTERGHICTHRWALFIPQDDMHAILCICRHSCAVFKLKSCSGFHCKQPSNFPFSPQKHAKHTSQDSTKLSA